MIVTLKYLCFLEVSLEASVSALVWVRLRSGVWDFYPSQGEQVVPHPIQMQGC